MFKWLLGAVAGACAIGAIVLAHAVDPDIDHGQSAVQYIKGLQNSDGGFPAFGVESTPGSTIDAVFALVAAGRNPTHTAAPSGNSPDDYLASQAAAYAADPGAAAKLALAVELMELDASSFGGEDLLQTMSANYNASTGEYGLDVFDQVFYMLALAHGGQSVPAAASSYLAGLQQGDSAWEFLPGFGTDTNTTAMVVQALIASGMAVSDPVITDAFAYLATAQNSDGGFGFLPAEPSDPNSTAVIIQALAAAEQDQDVGGPWAPGGNTPRDGLLDFRNPANGAFQYFGSDSAFATYQALPALVLGAFPALVPPPGVGSADTDGDGCPDADEEGPAAVAGGLRNYMNPWDYFNPTSDGLNRVDDILAVVMQYFIDAPGVDYTASTDRTYEGPEPWNLSEPNGQQRVDDILAAVKSYFHDCA